MDLDEITGIDQVRVPDFASLGQLRITPWVIVIGFGDIPKRITSDHPMSNHTYTTDGIRVQLAYAYFNHFNLRVSFAICTNRNRHGCLSQRGLAFGLPDCNILLFFAVIQIVVAYATQE